VRQIAKVFYVGIEFGSNGFQGVFHVAMLVIVLCLVTSLFSTQVLITRLGSVATGMLFFSTAFLATVGYMPVVKFLLHVFACSARLPDPAQTPPSLPPQDPARLLSDGLGSGWGSDGVSMSVHLPTERCQSPLHMYYCVSAVILIVLHFVNAYVWIASTVNNVVERAKQSAISIFTLAPGRSRFAALALLTRSIFVVPLVFLQQRHDATLSSTLLFVFATYYFIGSIGWAPYVNYRTNRWLTAVLAMVVWTNAVGMGLTWMTRNIDDSEVSTEGWYGILVWLAGLPFLCTTGYFLAQWRQRHSINSLLHSRVIDIFADKVLVGVSANGQGQAATPTDPAPSPSMQAPALSFGPGPDSSTRGCCRRCRRTRQHEEQGRPHPLYDAGQAATTADAPDELHTEGEGSHAHQSAHSDMRISITAEDLHGMSREASQRHTMNEVGAALANVGRKVIAAVRQLAFFPPLQSIAKSFFPTTGPSRRTYLFQVRNSRIATPRGSIIGSQIDSAITSSGFPTASASAREPASNTSRNADETSFQSASSVLVDWRECLVGLNKELWHIPHIVLASLQKAGAMLLSSNRLTSQGTRNMLSAMTANPLFRNLHTLDLSNNPDAFDNVTASAKDAKIQRWQRRRGVAQRCSLSTRRCSCCCKRGTAATVAPCNIDEEDDIVTDSSSVATYRSADSTATLETGIVEAVDLPMTPDPSTKNSCGFEALLQFLRLCPTLRTLVLDGCLLSEQDVMLLVIALADVMSIPKDDLKQLVQYVSLASLQDASGRWTPQVSRKLAKLTDTGLRSISNANGTLSRWPSAASMSSVVNIESSQRADSSSQRNIMCSDKCNSTGSGSTSENMMPPSPQTEQGTGLLNTLSPMPTTGAANGQSEPLAGPNERKSGAVPGLHWLSLSQCKLGLFSVKWISALLAHPRCTLRKLTLSHNNLGPGTAFSLANALAVNQSMKELDATWNRLGFDGIRLILESLPFAASRAISVQLHSNKVERASLVMLKTSQKKKKKQNTENGKSFIGGNTEDASTRLQNSNDAALIDQTISGNDVATPGSMLFNMDSILNGRTYYELIGGEEVVGRVVDTFYLLLVSDPVVGPRFFHHITMSRMRHLQKNYICKLLGGPQEYEGRDMLYGHRHLGINDDYFDQVLAHFGTAFVHHLVGDAAVPGVIEGILDTINTLRDKIVTRTVGGDVVWKRSSGQSVKGLQLNLATDP
jgi:hemoglobin